MKYTIRPLLHAKKILIGFLVMLTVTSPVTAYNQFYMDNDIFSYDSTAEECVATGSGSGVGGDGGGENAEEILRFFTDQGLSLAAAAGFVGNMQQESNLRPDIIQGGATAPESYRPVDGVGFGLVQWTFTPRQAPLVELANTTDRSIINMRLQLDYVWQEINGPYKSTLQALAGDEALTPTEAAIIIHGRTPKTQNDPRFASAPRLGYEASNDTAEHVVEVRGGFAESIYKEYRDTISDGTGVEGYGGGGSAVKPSSCESTSPVGGCETTKPLYGAGGNGRQLSMDQLISLYGDPDAVTNNLQDVDFLGNRVVIHEKVAGCLEAVANDIEESGVNYDIQAIGGYRRDGTGHGQIGDKSYHTYGVAVDINPETNPFLDHPIADYDMPPEYVRAFNGRGWSWGGDWSGPYDYMHFEYNGIGPEGDEA